MGRPKAWLDVGGVPMAVRVASVLAGAGCDPVVFVGAAPPPRIEGVHDTVPDLFPDQGPLGGVISALRSGETDVVVAACDLPRVTRSTVHAVLTADPGGSADVVVAVAAGHHVPLALWRHRSLGRLAASFDAGSRSWRSALDLLTVVEVVVDDGSTVDVDTPDDLRVASDAVGDHGRGVGRDGRAQHGDGRARREPGR